MDESDAHGVYEVALRRMMESRERVVRGLLPFVKSAGDTLDVHITATVHWGHGAAFDKEASLKVEGSRVVFLENARLRAALKSASRLLRVAKTVEEAREVEARLLEALRAGGDE